MGADVEIVPTEHPRAFVLRVGGHDQSHVDLADPGRLSFDYVRRMGDVIDLHAEPGRPLRLLHIGGGGLTLPRYVAHTRPSSAQVVLEPATEMTERVRAELPLPRRSGIKVRAVAGRPGTAQVRADSTDLVVLDAYQDGRVPADLLTGEFFAEVSRVLDDGGALLANLSDRAPFAHTRRVLGGIRETWPHLLLSAEPATLRGRRDGNLLVVASAAPVPVPALRRCASGSPAPYRVLDGGQVSDSFGGGTPLRD